jgi:type II secretion system protein H
MRTRTRSLSIRQPAGFSLLEMLLVLVVIGLIVSLAGLSVTSGSQAHKIDSEVRRFVDIAEYAMDEAQLSGTDMGVRIDLEDTADGTVYSYQWLQRAGNVWRVAPLDEDAYGRKQLPPGVAVVLQIEQDVTDLEETTEEQEDGLPPAPQVVFYASGEAIPGIMTWVNAETRDVYWELEWDLLGRFEMYRRGTRDEAGEDRG